MYASKLSLVFLLIFTFQASFGQTNLDSLLKERSILYKDYEFYEKQKSSFWGTKSKKDLKNIIETLKGIIIKDNEIIKEINVASLQKNAQVVSKTQASLDWAVELENENNKLEILLKKSKFDYNELKGELELLESSEKLKNTMLFVLTIIVAGLFIYIIYMRQGLKENRQLT